MIILQVKINRVANLMDVERVYICARAVQWGNNGMVWLDFEGWYVNPSDI